MIFCWLSSVSTTFFLVAGEFVEEVFLGKFLPVFFFRTEFGGIENGHQRIGVQFVFLDFIGDLLSSFRWLLGRSGKRSIISWWFKPSSTGIPHPGRIVDVFPGVQANQQIMGFGIFFIEKMHVVGGDKFDIQFPGYFDFLLNTALLIVVNLGSCLGSAAGWRITSR